MRDSLYYLCGTKVHPNTSSKAVCAWSKLSWTGKMFRGGIFIFIFYYLFTKHTMNLRNYINKKSKILTVFKNWELCNKLINYTWMYVQLLTMLHKCNRLPKSSKFWPLVTFLHFTFLLIICRFISLITQSVKVSCKGFLCIISFWWSFVVSVEMVWVSASGRFYLSRTLTSSPCRYCAAKCHASCKEPYNCHKRLAWEVFGVAHLDHWLLAGSISRSRPLFSLVFRVLY